jgi:hypothetical protein
VLVFLFKHNFLFKAEKNSLRLRVKKYKEKEMSGAIKGKLEELTWTDKKLLIM